MNFPHFIEITAATLFAIAVLHTFSTKFFEHLAHTRPGHAGLWHMLGEVEGVFGVWAAILLVFVSVTVGVKEAVDYLDSRNFTEPAFVFVIMVVAASRPILRAAELLMRAVARLLPMRRSTAYFFTLMSIGPLLGSFITEPAAMTLTAIMLRDHFLSRGITERTKYAIIGVLFVNVSVGGALTPYAAPPILMVAATWNWGFVDVISQFGVRSAIVVLVNAAALTWLIRKQLTASETSTEFQSDEGRMPAGVILIHLAFLAGVVVFNHHIAVFLGLFLFFLGYTEAYKQFQRPLILREGLMVGFFLAGLVVLGGMQKWWLQPVLAGLDGTVLFLGATALTAITDNAALTYLGSLVQGITDEFKYALVAGAITGGGLTVIANAPNPAGYSILKSRFEDDSIGALGLFLAALPPTLVGIVVFWGDRFVRSLL
jgi:Na+/H+ antiporter NhaD/arsenite permease-like protein